MKKKDVLQERVVRGTFTSVNMIRYERRKGRIYINSDVRTYTKSLLTNLIQLFID
jgi:hypothetical protein